MNEKILFNDKWLFAKSSLNALSIDNLKFKSVDIPHDWLIYNTENLYENSIGWYKRYLKIDEDMLNSNIILSFDGVYMDSTLYLNGEKVGEWKYGYSSFEFNITKYLHKGDNEILLKVMYQNPNSRWYSGAGIYRNVYLKIRSENYILTNGIYVSTKRKDKKWSIEVDTELKVVNNAILKQILYKDKEVITESVRNVIKNDTKVKQILNVNDPKLWSPNEPNLYKLTTELRDENGGLIERIEQNLGFREIDLNPDKGLILNGQKVKINGVCEHHDFGALGAAFNVAALKRKFKLLKEMGVNGIRIAHNMPAPELMNLADEMGFLVMSEAFDMWERSKTKYDYGRFFKKFALEDVKSWITRDRNHPCVFLWSIGNEIYDTHVDSHGQDITSMLTEEVYKYDYNKNAKVTIASNYMTWENAQRCADLIKIVGYNYTENLYKEHHKKHPDWIIYGSETGSLVQSRGVYHFPLEEQILSEEDEQCSSLGNSATSWGAKSIENCIINERDNDFSLGQFIWTGFDYIGEPTPYHTKNSYFGQLDTATFKKDAYYIFQAEWTNYKENPMIHIFPYWDFNEGQLIDVRVCTNAPKAELRVNGITIEKFDINHQKDLTLVKSWKVPYKKGYIDAIAYDEEGKVIARETRRSFEDGKKISLLPDKKEIIADGRDLIYLEINVKDKNDSVVENARNRVKVKVTGEGRLVGLDNGDSTDYDQYKGCSRRLFNGKLMAIIMSTLNEGKINVEVEGKDLESKSITFTSIKPSEVPYGLTAEEKNLQVSCVMGNLDEIPVRKIEIISDKEHKLNSKKRSVEVRAKLYPPNTSYKDVKWSLVNNKGVTTNIAKIEDMGYIAKILAIGDGKFKVRCTSTNGTDKTKIISEIEYVIDGLGQAYKNPYKFISASLYDFNIGEVGNGNEKGIASSRNGDTVIAFKNIDFGKQGSDTIILPIFALDDSCYSFEIYEGIYGKNSNKIICNGKYEKPSIWNVYQEENYKLCKTLKGIKDISFVFHDKIHLKGFYFVKENKGLNHIFAVEADNIYGDEYKLFADRVEEIGNNVSFVFNDLDFGTEGITKIKICGKSPIDKNMINIHFENKDIINKQMVEFEHTTDYEVKSFNLKKICGVQKVTLIFLPGSNFNLKWICFQK